MCVKLKVARTLTRNDTLARRLHTAKVRIEVGMADWMADAQEAAIRVDDLHIVGVVEVQPMRLLQQPEQRECRIQTDDCGRLAAALDVLGRDAGHVRAQRVPDQYQIGQPQAQPHQVADEAGRCLAHQLHAPPRLEVVERPRAAQPIDRNEIEIAAPQIGVRVLHERFAIAVIAVDEDARRPPGTPIPLAILYAQYLIVGLRQHEIAAVEHVQFDVAQCHRHRVVARPAVHFVEDVLLGNENGVHATAYQ